MRKTVIRVVFYSSALCIMAFMVYGRSIWVPAYLKIKGKRTVEEVIARYGPGAEKRLSPYFTRSGIEYPPEKIALVALKEEKRLELWGFGGGAWRKIKEYDILGASGASGPKLKQGDHQVPEGFYGIIGLNPNSSYHLSMKLDYPNAFDLEQAKAEKRDNLGGDIFIHGKSGSVGCLAMGDPAIEELFTVVDKVGRSNAAVIIAPWDFRERTWNVREGSPPWLPGLYAEIDKALNTYTVMPEE